MYNANNRFQDESILPRGMNDFARWYRPKGREDYGKKRPSDIDGMLHLGWNVQAWLMFEIKPQGRKLSLGQEIRLKNFSLLPNATSICIYEPDWNDSQGRDDYPDDTVIYVQSWRDGVEVGKVKTTVGKLNARIGEWFDGKGILKY